MANAKDKAKDLNAPFLLDKKLLEISLERISKNGEVVINFSKEIDFPSDLLKPRVTSFSSKARKKLQIEERGKFGAIEKFLNVKMLDRETETLSDNLTSWKVTAISRTQISIDLTFARPIEVSQNYEKDMLLVVIDLADFKDSDVLHLP